MLDIKQLVQNLANNYTLVVEGGNAVDGVVRINQENVQATLRDIYSKLFPALKLDDTNTAILGSTGKRLPGGSSGDIDIGIDKKAAKIDNFNAWSKYVANAANRLKIDYNVLSGLKEISLKWPISNEDGKQKNKFVQVDLMPVDDLEFNKFSKFTPQETADQPYYKSTIRNSILATLAHVLEVKVNKTGSVAGVGDDVPVDVVKYHYDLDAGLEQRHVVRKQKKDGTYNKTWTILDKKLVVTKPQKIIDIFFGKGHKVEDVESPVKTWELAMKSPLLKDKKNMEKFIKDLRADLEPKLERQGITLPPSIAKALKLQESEKLDEAGRKGQDFSAIDSPREALTKIHQLTGSKLKDFLQDFKDGLDDSSLLIKTTPKIDGHPFRVAWIDDKAYIETSYSGLMGAEEIKNQHIPKHEQQFFDYINKQDKTALFKELKRYNLTGIKILGELLANGKDFADDNGTITYVGTTYDATKLGKLGSVVVIDIKGATLEELTDLKPDVKKKIIDFLALKFSDKNASYFDINQFAQDIDISEEDFPSELVSTIKDNDISSMKSSVANDVKMQINAALTDIFKDKFKNPSIMKKDDKSLEGVAFELNGKLYGVHYQSWKDIRQGYYKDIDEIKDFVKIFLAKLTDMTPMTPISKMVNTIRADLPTYQAKYKKMYKKFLSRRKELVDKMMSDKTLPKFVRSVGQDRAKTLLSKFKDADITDDVNSLLNIIVGPVKDMKGKTVAIIPGSFRPPHKGHLALIEHYSKLADEVIVAVSGQANVSAQRPDKFGRTMPNYVVGQILKIYCDAYGLKNVKIAMTMKLMQWVGWKIKTMKNVKIMLGVSGKDDASRFSAFTSDRFKKNNPDIEILPIEKNSMDAVKQGDENVSATYVRQNIDDKKILKKVLPSKLTDKQFDEVYELMNPPSGKYPSMDDKRTADALFVPESDKMVNESGSAFDDVVRIDAENVDDTIADFKKKFCKFAKIKDNDVVPLGSTGKRLPGQSSGDLDLGISLTAVSKSGVDIEDKNAWFDFCKKFADTEDVKYYEYKARGLTSVRWPIVNSDGKQSHKFVQIDMIPHKNLKMLQWGMYQSKEVPGQDYDKSAVRALLLQAIVKMGFLKVLKTGNVPKEGKDVPVKIERYEYKQNDGLFKMIKERPLKKDGTYGTTWKDVNKHKVTDDPQKIIDFIFGNSSYAPDNLLSVKEIWDAFVKSKFYKDKDLRAKIQKDFEDKMEQFKFPYPKYVKFTESVEEAEDSKSRVAVIITDGTNTIVGKAPQQMKKTENCCDLFKGHAEVGEKLEDAAKREVYEEAGIKLDSIVKISDALKYSKGTTLTFFKAKVDKLPDVSSLKCKSFYEYNGKKFPEIAAYLKISLDDLPKYLYKGLAKLIIDNDIIAAVKKDIESESEEVCEGGNAVSDVVRINKSNVESTVEQFKKKVLPLLDINDKDTAILGSAGKKETSGDIDIGIDKIKNIRQFLVDAEKKLNANDIENYISWGFNEISIRWPIENSDGKQKNKFVQIDLMPCENLSMLKWGMHSPTQEESKYKGVVRNLLLCDIAAFTDRKTIETVEVNGKEQPIVYERYVLLTQQGLFRKTYSFKGKKPGTLKKTPDKTNAKFITSDPTKIVKLIFGASVKPEDVMTIDDLWKVFKKTPMYKDASIRSQILKKTVTELKSRSGLKYPSYIEQAINESYVQIITNKLINELFNSVCIS